jgi:hypothetical protein
VPPDNEQELFIEKIFSGCENQYDWYWPVVKSSQRCSEKSVIHQIGEKELNCRLSKKSLGKLKSYWR